MSIQKLELQSCFGKSKIHRTLENHMKWGLGKCRRCKDLSWVTAGWHLQETPSGPRNPVKCAAQT